LKPGLPRSYTRRVRILERLEQLYAIGGGPGANRVHGTPGEDEALELAAGWMRDAGLVVDVDPDGNLVGRSSRSPGIWTGSHLDSVPQGGRYDGALGVVAGLEAVEQAGAGSVVVFRGEEVGCVGSRALVARGHALPEAFLEVHVEQGPVLAQADAPLGVVTGIVGYVRGELVFEGDAGHAGTTPMAGRADALVAAADAVLRIRGAALGIEGAVATVGQAAVEPGGSNVIPSRVRISVDARAPDSERLDELVAAIGVEPAQRTEPAHMDRGLRDLLRDELAARGLPVLELASGAGHDAGILAAAGVPSAMLFVRSLNGGVSHTPEELSSAEDIALAVDVLTGSLSSLAS
jgi:allantoate deiminase